MRVALIFVIAACATTRECGGGGETPCWKAAPESVFALPPPSAPEAAPANVTRVLMSAHVEECGDDAGVTTTTWHQNCAAQFQFMMGQHCDPLVRDWCAANCAAGCAVKENKAKVQDTCASGAKAGFMTAMRYCTGLELRGDTFAVPASGGPTCP